MVAPKPPETVMRDPATAQTILKENFAPWVQGLQPTVAEISPEGCTLDIPVTPDIARVGGIVCGQALVTLADTAMVLACIGHMGEFQPVATTNLETRFLAAARGERIRCQARILKAGRALFFAEATLMAEPDRRTVALASATLFRP
ncbi:PaaI family thioesterase [Sagittula sp. M10.9X]|uniref:PaaI family thioesterase n=2 Tax=Sagittula salina TaxID=2820268 RepID=A0A940MRC4_9RHOB|nr:PaaI family thioesterase [Sagittula salina]